MDKLSKYLNYLIVIAILSVVAVYFYINSNSKNPTKRDSASVPKQDAPDVDEIVNKYLKQTAEQSVRERLQTQMMIQKQIVLPAKKPTEDSGSTQGYSDGSSNKIPASVLSQIHRNTPSSGSDEVDKKEYARQFKENALKNGYYIELNDNLEVIKVTPVRQPSGSDSTDSFPED